MSDVTIGNSGSLFFEISQNTPPEPVVASGRKIVKLDNNSGFKLTEMVSVEINLYALKDRVKLETETNKITFEDILDAIPDIENLNILRYEIATQISNIDIKTINKKLEDFSKNCIEIIDDKINKIANKPRENEQITAASNNKNSSDKPAKISVPLNNQAVIAKYLSKYIDSQVKNYLVKNYKDTGVKKLPVAPKTRVSFRRGQLSLINSKKQTYGATETPTPKSQNSDQNGVVATVKLRYFGNQEIPPWINKLLVAKNTLAGSMASNHSVSYTSSKAAPTKTSSITTNNTVAALTQPSTNEEFMPQQKQSTLDKPPLLPPPDEQPKIISDSSPSPPPIVSQPKLKSPRVGEANVLEKQADNLASENPISQQTINNLKHLEFFFEEDDQIFSKKGLLTLEGLKNKVERLSASIQKFIDHQLKREDPCQAKDTIYERLKAVKMLKKSLEQSQQSISVNAALVLLQNSLNDLTAAGEKAEDACRKKRKIELSKNFSLKL